MDYKERFYIGHKSINGLRFNDTLMIKSLVPSAIFKQIKPFWDVAVRLGESDRYVMQQIHTMAIRKYISFHNELETTRPKGPWKLIDQDADVLCRAWSVAYGEPLKYEKVSLWGSQGHDALDLLRIKLIRKYL